MRSSSIIGLVSLICLGAGHGSLADEPAPGVTGTLKLHDKFKSEFVDPRNVNVWLPPSYESSPHARYPVLYMHDGQNLHDPKTSFIGVDWGVDEAMTKLIAEKKIREAIVVGIWNTPKRVQEYLPEKMILAHKEKNDFANLARRGLPLDEKHLLSDEYLRFIVTELKPFIDKTYRTKTGRDDTFMMGSSAGALISLYGIAEYPDVIGGIGCVSTHFPVGNGAMVEYMKGKLPDPKQHRIYFDFGTKTLDHNYEPFQTKMDEVMRQAGYEPGKNWVTKKFEGAEHSEKSWRQRVHVPLEFLLKP